MLAGGTVTFSPVSGSSPKSRVTVKVYLPGVVGVDLKINVEYSAKRSTLVYSFVTDEQVMRYGKNNKFDNSGTPTKIKYDTAQSINIHVALQDPIE